MRDVVFSIFSEPLWIGVRRWTFKVCFFFFSCTSNIRSIACQLAFDNFDRSSFCTETATKQKVAVFQKKKKSFGQKKKKQNLTI